MLGFLMAGLILYLSGGVTNKGRIKALEEIRCVFDDI